MAIYQPTAVVGNSRLLVTLGSKGELMGLFYPHVDFPQNLREGMPAVYFFGEGAAGYLSWTFAPEWQFPTSAISSAPTWSRRSCITSRRASPCASPISSFPSAPAWCATSRR